MPRISLWKIYHLTIKGISGQEVEKNGMQMLDLEERIDQLAKANSTCWHEHVLRKDRNNFLKALDFRVKGTMKRARLEKTWLKSFVEQLIGWVKRK